MLGDWTRLEGDVGRRAGEREGREGRLVQRRPGKDLRRGYGETEAGKTVSKRATGVGARNKVDRSSRGWKRTRRTNQVGTINTPTHRPSTRHAKRLQPGTRPPFSPPSRAFRVPPPRRQEIQDVSPRMGSPRDRSSEGGDEGCQGCRMGWKGRRGCHASEGRVGVEVERSRVGVA